MEENKNKKEVIKVDSNDVVDTKPKQTNENEVEEDSNNKTKETSNDKEEGENKNAMNILNVIWKQLKKCGSSIHRTFKRQTLIVKIIIIAIIAVLISYQLGQRSYSIQTPNDEVITPEPTVVQKVVQPLLSDRRIEIGEAIAASSKEESKLIVYSVELEREDKYVDGWHDFKVFNKTKTVKYFATAKYGVDLSKINQDYMAIDDENNAVVIYIPRATLDSLDVHLEQTEFGETKKELLAFGEMEFTTEDSNAILAEAKRQLNIVANEQQYLDEANRLAVKQIQAYYQQALNTFEDLNAKVVIRQV